MPLYEIDRMIAILRPTNAFLDWINQHSKSAQEKMTLSSLQEDCTALLIPPFDNSDEADDFIASNYSNIFENELEGWFLNPKDWPENRTIELFSSWFVVEYHSVAFDVTNEDEEITGYTGTLQ